MKKLSNKSSFYFLITTLIVFLISGVIIFFLLQYIIQSEVDETLLEQKERIIQNLKDTKNLTDLVLSEEIVVDIKNLPTLIQSYRDHYNDTLIQHYDFEDKKYELEPYRQYKFAVTHNNKTHLITIRKSLIEADDIIETIFFSFSLIFVIMIFALMVLNSFTIKRIWQPFQVILNRIENFNFQSGKEYKPVSTDIKEFNNLNDKLSVMTKKLTEDYFTLKEFSENASHEMQTPLAIIQTKLELLFQQNNISEENLKTLQTIYQAVNRLSRLHKELNLLTRIENLEYTEQQSISIKSVIENQLENYSDIIDIKKLKLKTDLQSDHTFIGNKYLMEIMVSNLLSNAIQHNINEGWINIYLTNEKFIISNSGENPHVSIETLFDRFKKSKQSTDSSGLGLAIVKKICSIYNLNIEYIFKENEHTLTISF